MKITSLKMTSLLVALCLIGFVGQSASAKKVNKAAQKARATCVAENPEIKGKALKACIKEKTSGSSKKRRK